MFDFIANALPTVVVLGVLIFIHELGHFLFAKMSGVDVEKFSMGFGPEIIKFTHQGTSYALSIIPFGGFVKMAGETIEDRKDSDLKASDFLSQGIVKRFMIIFAGPLMNYVLAFVLLIAVFMMGKPALAPVVGDLVEEFPAQKAGISIHDTIVAVDGVNVVTWDDVRNNIAQSESRTIEIIVLRDSMQKSIMVSPEVVVEESPFGDEMEMKKIGIFPSEATIYIKHSFVESIRESYVTIYSITKLTYRALFRLVTGRLNPKALSGPLGIMVITSKTAKRGFIFLLQLTAFLSVSLAIFNLLPIPALDGGHLFFIMCEAILRKPISFKLQERFAQVGFVLLMVLMVFVVWNDAVNFEIVDKFKRLLPFAK